MIATKDSFEPHSSDQLPNSRRVYVAGIIHPDIRVPMREIELAPTKSFNGRIEVNEPARLYDCSGPWGDRDFNGTVEEGLPPLRRDWVLRRGDVEEYEGRSVKPIDDGYLSETHQTHAAKRQDPTHFKLETRNLKPRRPLRASAGHPVTQLWYARQGIITPEMEFIAIRENGARASGLCGVQASRLHNNENGRDAHSPHSRDG
ncbi:MAG TPA: phosphomethylpyrimidine synthase, partial [Verrucomicrobiae bacterium]|nr:phosphomethylpyrimidine synthase [Verrucomicrobiae bacterium]